MTASYRDGTEADVAAIDRVFRASFCETFVHLYSARDLETFLGKFTAEAWRSEIADERVTFRLAEVGGETIGFAKLGPLTLPVETAAPAVELRQIYILESFHGTGIGRDLMDWAIGEAKRRGAKEMFLTVYTDNHRARRVYERYGFEVIGPYAFMVGEQADEDVIMRKSL
jgi:GNAT superfamily N-acetyltransferase